MAYYYGAKSLPDFAPKRLRQPLYALPIRPVREQDVFPEKVEIDLPTILKYATRSIGLEASQDNIKTGIRFNS